MDSVADQFFQEVREEIPRAKNFRWKTGPKLWMIGSRSIQVTPEKKCLTNSFALARDCGRVHRPTGTDDLTKFHDIARGWVMASKGPRKTNGGFDLSQSPSLL